MGKEILDDHLWDETERDYFTSRGQSYKVVENTRKFGEKAQPEVDEAVGLTKGTPPDDPQGGDPVQGLPGPQVGQQAPAATEPEPEDDGEGGIDDDIAELVSEMTIAELKAALDEKEADYEPRAKHDDLAAQLANVLQDERDEENA
jgi:hypothetical protein